jgi:hypothetical protein
MYILYFHEHILYRWITEKVCANSNLVVFTGIRSTLKKYAILHARICVGFVCVVIIYTNNSDGASLETTDTKKNAHEKRIFFVKSQ